MELDFVAWLRERLPDHPHLRLGVGDDAALIAAAEEEVVVTTDLLIDGVHFLSEKHSPEQIGHKALAVNLSDLAAMAARPIAAVVSLALPGDGLSRNGAGGLSPRELAVRLIEGMLPLAERYDCPIAGGDTNLGPGPIVISITAIGSPTSCGLLRRNGAQVGDQLLVTGSLGGSLAGKHLDFEPRVAEAQLLCECYHLTAGMDLTDGLSIDLARLAKASNVGAIVNEATLPIADAAHKIAKCLSPNPSGGSQRLRETEVPDGLETYRECLGRSALEHALHDGEDFELLFTTSPSEAKRLTADQPIACGVTLIGEIVATSKIATESNLLLRDTKNVVKNLEPRGYEH